MEKKWLTPAEIAEQCGVTTMAVWAWVRRGKLKAYRFGRSYRIDESDFRDFMENAKPRQ